MSIPIAILFLVFFCVRLLTLAISIKNEKRLKQAGAQEYGQLNSLVLAILHVLFYLGAAAEGYFRGVRFDSTTLLGLVIYSAAMAALFYVIHALRPLWTVKIILAREHTLNTDWLFKYVRHPNYFLNILPELIGLALVMKSRTVFLLVFPLYVISLGVRIFQEEKIMRRTFSDY